VSRTKTAVVVTATESQMKYWDLFPHDADIGIRGVGTSKQEAFEEAAIALTAVVTDPQCVRLVEEVSITCSAPDDELLLADWLNALIYEMSTRKMLFGRFEVHVDRGTLNAKAWGETVDNIRHEPAVEPKGATYTELKVRQDSTDIWIAQCVVDV
jgi:tRNA nucleotidyltransferase (CCA-adding enzyme)